MHEPIKKSNNILFEIAEMTAKYHLLRSHFSGEVIWEPLHVLSHKELEIAAKFHAAYILYKV